MQRMMDEMDTLQLDCKDVSKSTDALNVSSKELEEEVSAEKKDPINKSSDGKDVKPDGNSVFKKPSFIGKFPRITKVSGVKGKTPVPLPGGKDYVDNGAEASPSKKEAQILTESPAQNLKERLIPVPYKEPSWSGLPSKDYYFEVLKGGIIVETVALNKSFFVIGRNAQCDIAMEHPSISRFHCVLQYRAVGTEGHPEGFYAYDLGSTHGSFQNKSQMKPETYCRVCVGHILKFGGSSRMFILQGPSEDEEPAMNVSYTELKDITEERAEKLERLEQMETEGDDHERVEKNQKSSSHEGKVEDSGGIDWGMGEDAVEEGDEDEEDHATNPFASTNEELYLDDPKKTLRGWFEREGYDLPNYETEDTGPGRYRCRVELPVVGSDGNPLIAVVDHKGKKKEAVVQCALEACRLLDRHGSLRQATHDSHRRKEKNWAENDYYDSDEDDFLDRTGDVQRKRLKRMKQAEASAGYSSIETYDSLMSQYTKAVSELESLEKKLAHIDRLKRHQEEAASGRTQTKQSGIWADEDDLDLFMSDLRSHLPDKHKRVAWKMKVVELRKEELRLRKLVNVARPPDVRELQPLPEFKYSGSTSKQDKKQMLFSSESHISKVSLLGVHKAFVDEDSEPKPKLSRLDGEDEGPQPIPYSHSKDKKKTYSRQYKSRVERQEEFSSKSEPAVGKSAHESVSHTTNGEHVEPEASCQFLDTGDNNIDSQMVKDSVGVTEKPLKRSKILGPHLPAEDEKHKYSKVVQEDHLAPERSEKYEYDVKNPDYEMWVPPRDQTGDGITELNAKLGY